MRVMNIIRNKIQEQPAGLSFITVFLPGNKNNRKLICRLAAVLIAFLMCQPIYLPAQAVSLDDWNGVKGTLIQDGGSQYRDSKLQLFLMDNECVLFEFDLLQGSEAEEAIDFRLSGTFYMEEDGTGTWEEETENGMVSLLFVLNGNKVSVTQAGTLPISVEGTYTWLEENFEVTEECAGELLEGLATAATSLTSENRPYHLEISNMVVDGWFYNMKAIFTQTGALIGEFLIATDLSAVYRIDTEAPTLIFGSADSMMEAVYEVAADEDEALATVVYADSSEAGTEAVEVLSYSVPLVYAMPSSSTLNLGEKAKITTVTPGNVPAIITCTSENPEVATVDEDGVIQAVTPGVAVINGTVSVDGSIKAFSFEIDVWSNSIQALDIQTIIPVGESITMKAHAVGVSDPIQWSVSDTDLAGIDADTGIFTGKKEGQLLMIAQAGDLRREWTVTVGSIVASVDDNVSKDFNPVLLAAIVAAAFVIGVTVFVIIRRKPKSHPPKV